MAKIRGSGASATAPPWELRNSSIYSTSLFTNTTTGQHAALQRMQQTEVLGHVVMSRVYEFRFLRNLPEIGSSWEKLGRRPHN